MAALRKNGMAQRFTWDDAALKYEVLYRNAIKLRRGAEYYRNRFGE
jgi:starch synthase